ncbi:MAG: FMN-dependent NADH-azoreductase [Candidatus Pseudothioglobus sp.]|jgi:FMN-dependent NADH-azoreductase
MSKHILQIDSSVFGARGQSSQLAAGLVEKLRGQCSDATLTHRDVTAEQIPHFTLDTIQAIAKGEAELADALISEVQRADILVISAPMYNFSIPTALKAWLDHITRAQTTFTYVQSGPVGLLTGKKVFVVATRGGFHKDKPEDAVVPYLKTILSFIGLSDVEFIYAEGLAMTDHKDQGLVNARADISALVG